MHAYTDIWTHADTHATCVEGQMNRQTDRGYFREPPSRCGVLINKQYISIVLAETYGWLIFHYVGYVMFVTFS